jgi:hypothetical protein
MRFLLTLIVSLILTLFVACGDDDQTVPDAGLDAAAEASADSQAVTEAAADDLSAVDPEASTGDLAADDAPAE